MTSKIKLLVAADMIFLLLLASSGSSSGFLSELLYALAFAVPIGMALGYLYNPQKSSQASGTEVKPYTPPDFKSDFTISKKGVSLSLPLIFPSILLILGVSVLTSLLLSRLGYENETSFSSPFAIALITHALVPAVAEELLFRFVPIKLLWENKKTALVLSAVMFAFAHANLFQIPYALLAGLIFALLYLITGSVIPSMILHFLNNAVSLSSMYGVPDTILIISLSALAAISLVFIILMRKRYKEAVISTFGKEKIVFSYYPLFFIALSLLFAIPVLFL